MRSILQAMHRKFTGKDMRTEQHNDAPSQFEPVAPIRQTQTQPEQGPISILYVSKYNIKTLKFLTLTTYIYA